jgi:hypothetical protein
MGPHPERNRRYCRRGRSSIPSGKVAEYGYNAVSGCALGVEAAGLWSLDPYVAGGACVAGATIGVVTPTGSTTGVGSHY